MDGKTLLSIRTESGDRSSGWDLRSHNPPLALDLERGTVHDSR